MRNLSISIILCLVVVLLGCNDSTLPSVPSPQLSPRVTPPPDATKVSVALTATPVSSDTPVPSDTSVPTDTPAPLVTPVLAVATPNAYAGGLQILQYDYYGDGYPINFVGVVKNNSSEPIKHPQVTVDFKNAFGNVVFQARDTVVGGVPHERMLSIPTSSQLGAGQSAGFQVQVVNQPPAWITAEVRVVAVKLDKGYQPYLASRPDIKAVNVQLQPADYGYTAVHGELQGESRADVNVTVVGTAFDDAGKVLDVGYGVSGNAISDIVNGKRTFDLVWKRSDMKVASYEFTCFANKELNGSEFTDRLGDHNR